VPWPLLLRPLLLREHVCVVARRTTNVLNRTQSNGSSWSRKTRWPQKSRRIYAQLPMRGKARLTKTSMKRHHAVSLSHFTSLFTMRPPTHERKIPTGVLSYTSPYTPQAFSASTRHDPTAFTPVIVNPRSFPRPSPFPRLEPIRGSHAAIYLRSQYMAPNTAYTSPSKSSSHPTDTRDRIRTTSADQELPLASHSHDSASSATGKDVALTDGA